MADKRIKGITIELNGNTSGLDNALKSVESESRKAQSELRSVDRAMKDAPESAELWKQKQQLLNKVLEESEKKLKILEEAQSQVEEHFKNKEIDGSQYRAFQRELETTRAKVEQCRENVREFGSAANKAGEESVDASRDVEKLGDNIEEAGEQAQESSDGYTVLKDVLSDLAVEGIKKVTETLTESTKAAMEFESSVAKLSTIANPEFSMDKMKSDLIALSNDSGKAVVDLTNAAYDAISAGQDTADAVAFVGSVTDLARAGFAETADTLDLLTTILNAYGLKSSEVTRVSDMLIQTQNLGKTTVAQLASAMGKVIPTANASGVALDQLTAAYAVMTSKGVSTAETTTYLNSMINELSKSGTKSSDTLKNKTGKSFRELIADGKSLSDILAVIKQSADEQNKSFGDMWGSAEAGKAGLIILGESAQAYNEVLSEMRSSAGAAETAIGKLNTSSFQIEKAQNQLKNTMIMLGSDVLKELAPIAETILPELESGLRKVDANLPAIEKHAKIILSIAAGIGTAIGTWKLANTAIAGAEALSKLGGAFTTLLANPVIAAGAAIAALTAGIAVYYTTREKELSIAEKVAAAYKAESDAIERTSEKIGALNKGFRENAESIDYEYKRAESLWKELDKLADVSGRVKDADKARAEYILGELNHALGTEYTMTGNQINNYRTLREEIEKTIAQKKSQALLDAYLANAADMGKLRQSSLKEYQEADERRNKAVSDIEAAQKKFDSVNPGKLTAQQVYDIGINDVMGITNEQYEAAKALLTKQSEEANAKADMNVARGNYGMASEYFKNADSAMSAMADGDFQSVERILYYNVDGTKEALEEIAEFNNEARKIYKEGIASDTAALRLALRNREKDQVDSALRTMGETVTIAKKKGAESGELFTDEMRAQFRKLADGGFDLSGLASWAWDSGMDIAEIFGDQYSSIIQSQLDKGYDITDLLKWGKESGIKVSELYSREYKKIIQQKLDEGYDITELLRWGASSGFDVSFMFSGEFMKEFQSTIDGGFDTSALMQWAHDIGISMADLFGANFNSYASQYIWNTLTEVENGIWEYTGSGNKLYGTSQYEGTKKPNSPGDVQFYGRKAVGGYIPLFGEGIVADGGPELIQALNGGIRVTPLTGNNTNTSGSTQNIVKNFYNTYNINEPRISSSMDIRQIARDMAAEQRYIENGRGLK